MIEFGLEAAVKALNDAKVNYDQIEYATCGYVYGDSTCGQRVLYQLGMTQVCIRWLLYTCTRFLVLHNADQTCISSLC